MAKALTFFEVRGENGRTIAFHEGDEVPDDIASKVGQHLLDGKPDTEDETPFAGLDFENADEALKAAVEQAAERIGVLEVENADLKEKLDEATVWREKILSGDLSDLDIDSLTASGDDDGTAAADDGGNPDGDEGTKTAVPAEPLFDPSEHSVEKVLEHLEGADEAEDARVRAAEKAGKNRKGIVGDDE